MAIDLTSASYDSALLDLLSEGTEPTFARLGDGGTKLYAWDIESGDRKIHQWSMPAALDFANASYDGAGVLDTSGYAAKIAFCFKPDGTRLYLYNSQSQELEEWSLTAWDITTLASVTTVAIFPDPGESWGLVPRSDGSELLLGEPGGLLRRHAMSTAWDLSTHTGDSGVDLAAGDPFNDDYQEDGTPHDFYLSDDETQLLILALDYPDGVIGQYTLDLGASEATFDSVTFVPGQFTEPSYLALDLSDDEEEMAVLAMGSGYADMLRYALVTATYVAQAHEASIPLRVGAAHEAVIPLRVGAAHEAVIITRMGAAHEASIPLRVGAAHTALIRQRIGAAHEARILMLQRLAQDHEALIPLQQYTQVAQAHEATIPLRVGAAHEASIPLRALVRQAHEADIPLRTAVAQAHEAAIPLLDHNPVRAAHAAAIPLLGAPRTHLTMAVTLTRGGQSINVIAWDIAADEGGYLYEGEVEVGLHGYATLEVNDAVTLDLFGETYSLVVESRRRDMNGAAGRRYVIGLRSPSIEHDFPRAEPVSRTFDTSIMARAAVEDLLGQAVTWELVDWPIPAFRLAWEDVSPIAAARQIIEAAGGTIQTDPDGTIRARHLYPVSPPDYATASPARVVDPQQHIVAAGESYAPRRLVDRLVIRDTVDGLFADRIEFEPDADNDRAGTVRVYPSPWRTNVVVTHTSNASLQLTHSGEVVREETEVVEFAAGRAALAFPIETLLSVEWLYVSLGGVSFDSYATELEAADEDGYSLARITYETRSIDYRLVSPTVDQAQLLLQEIA